MTTSLSFPTTTLAHSTASLLDLFDAPEEKDRCPISPSNLKFSQAKKVYDVSQGRTTGLFHSWAECSAPVSGYRNNMYQSFATIANAEVFLSVYLPPTPPTESVVDTPGYYGPPAPPTVLINQSQATFSEVAQLTYVHISTTQTTTPNSLSLLAPPRPLLYHLPRTHGSLPN